MLTSNGFSRMPVNQMFYSMVISFFFIVATRFSVNNTKSWKGHCNKSLICFQKYKNKWKISAAECLINGKSFRFFFNAHNE